MKDFYFIAKHVVYDGLGDWSINYDINAIINAETRKKAKELFKIHRPGFRMRGFSAPIIMGHDEFISSDWASNLQKFDNCLVI
jgi:hypothetical protein